MSSQDTFTFPPIPLQENMEGSRSRGSASVPQDQPSTSQERPLRVVLLGKTGSGKSRFGNTLIGKTKFTVNSSANSGTAKCESATKGDGEITVIDTPGFFDNSRDEKEVKPEIIKCIVECSPGPHAFLIFLKVEKYTEHEKQVVTKIEEYFSEEAFKYAVLVFTHGDQLDDNMTIEAFVSQNKALQELSEKCGGRCHVVDNKHWNDKPDRYRNNGVQVGELLTTIKTMVQNEGGCYTNEMLEAVERKIKEGEQTTGSREKAKSKVKSWFRKAWVWSLEKLRKSFLGRMSSRIRNFFGRSHEGYDSLGSDSNEEGETNTVQSAGESSSDGMKPKSE